MDDEDWYRRIRADLPDWPEDVIRRWIMGHGPRNEWPPTFDKLGEAERTEWRLVIGDMSLEALRGLRWGLEKVPLEPSALDGNGQVAIRILSRAFYAALHIFQRIAGFVEAIEKSGRLPVPPIFLRRPKGLEVEDGCHRLAALFHVQDKGGSVDSVHDAWIAEAPPDPW